MPLDGSEFKYEIDETTKLLIAARERIERGWVNRAGRIDGPHCIMTALYAAGAESVGAAHEAIRRAIGDRCISLWNDTHSHEDVLAAFDRAIASV